MPASIPTFDKSTPVCKSVIQLGFDLSSKSVPILFTFAFSCALNSGTFAASIPAFCIAAFLSSFCSSVSFGSL